MFVYCIRKASGLNMCGMERPEMFFFRSNLAA